MLKAASQRPRRVSIDEAGACGNGSETTASDQLVIDRGDAPRTAGSRAVGRGADEAGRPSPQALDATEAERRRRQRGTRCGANPVMPQTTLAAAAAAPAAASIAPSRR